MTVGNMTVEIMTVGNHDGRQHAVDRRQRRGRDPRGHYGKDWDGDPCTYSVAAQPKCGCVVFDPATMRTDTPRTLASNALPAKPISGGATGSLGVADADKDTVSYQILSYQILSYQIPSYQIPSYQILGTPTKRHGDAECDGPL